ncbi:methylenetetrahydrofolate reductase [Halobacteriales archaeon QS_1_68_17]|nr:MAG: methylenetetrahydrofolate reductase [Halobacteriales archaeon QS_1_68_17]
MALRSRSQSTQEGVRELLDDPRFELLPFESFDEQLDYLPDGAQIAITSSPQKGIMETVERSEQVQREGYRAVPHIAARAVRDEDQLDEIAGRLEDAGVTDVFVPGGDNEDPGAFESSYQLLVALAELGYEFEEVGITGYPEGHYFIDEETLWEHLEKKQPHATYITTQLCYNPDAIVDWIETVRERGTDLPVEVGLPGVMKYQRLMSISRKVGVGDSIEFLRKTTGLASFIKTLIGSRGKYTPDKLVDGLAPYVDDPEYGIRGVHIYTFNQSGDTEEWRQERLQ